MAATTKKDLSSRLVKTVPFLKAWARDPTKNASQIAQEMGVSPDTLYKQIIPEFIGLYEVGIKHQEDFPSNIVMYYNQHNNTSPETVLTEQEVAALKPVFERERTRQPRQQQQQQQQQQVYPSNPQQQDYVPPGYSQTTRGHGPRGPNLGTNAALISYIMERMRLAPQGQIPKFLEIFELNEDYYMTHPEKLQALFESQFTPLPGRMGFEQFMLSQPNYVYTQRPGYGFTGAQAAPAQGMGMGGPMGPMPNPQDPAFQQMLNQQYLEDQKEDRRMRHQANMTSQMVQATMTNMMQRSMEAKQPIGAEALQVGDIEEQYDSEGNLVGRKILRKQGGEGGGQGSSEPWKAIIELYKMEAHNQREEKIKAMDMGQGPNALMTTMIQSILNNSLKTDPIQFIKSIKEIGVDPFGQNQQNTMGGENIERWLDARLALQREELEILKIKHDWDIQDKANEEGKSNMQTFITGITGLVKDVAVPKLNKFIEGATNQMFQGGPPGAQGQGPPQQQRGPPPSQYAQQQQQPPPNIQAPPGYRVVMTPQGPAYARIQQPQAGMGMPPGARMQPPAGVGVPPTFEENEEQRLARQAQHIQHVANALGQKEQQLAAIEQEMLQREASAAQAAAYSESKVREANEALRRAKFQEERQSFEEFTKDELSNIMSQMQQKISQIQTAVVEKDKQELESIHKEVESAAVDDTETDSDSEPIAVSDDTGVYQGDYEEDREKLLKDRGLTDESQGTAPS